MFSERKSRYAGEKITIYLTIASLLNLVGCYYQQQMSANEYDFSENNPIKIIKNDSTVYVAEPYEYQLREDTLFVLNKQILDNKIERETWIGLPLNDIQLIKTDRIDSGDTILLVSVITAGIIVIAAIIYAIALENATYGPIFGK